MDALGEAALRNAEVFKFSRFVWHCLGLCDLEFYRPRIVASYFQNIDAFVVGV